MTGWWEGGLSGELGPGGGAMLPSALEKPTWASSVLHLLNSGYRSKETYCDCGSQYRAGGGMLPYPEETPWAVQTPLPLQDTAVAISAFSACHFQPGHKIRLSLG